MDKDRLRGLKDIFADGISSIKTNLSFSVGGSAWLLDDDYFELMFWEDDDKFYIRNYNILLSTDKETFYAAMDELEVAPKGNIRIHI